MIFNISRIFYKYKYLDTKTLPNYQNFDLKSRIGADPLGPGTAPIAFVLLFQWRISMHCTATAAYIRRASGEPSTWFPLERLVQCMLYIQKYINFHLWTPSNSFYMIFKWFPREISIFKIFDSKTILHQKCMASGKPSTWFPLERLV